MITVGSVRSTCKIPYVETLRSAMPNFSRTCFQICILILATKTAGLWVSSGRNGGIRSQTRISRSNIHMLIHTGSWTNGLRANNHKGHTGYERRGIFFSLLLFVFGFTTQMTIATFSPSPCQRKLYALEFCQNALLCHGILTRGSAPSRERATFRMHLHPTSPHRSIQAWKHSTLLCACVSI